MSARSIQARGGTLFEVGQARGEVQGVRGRN